MPSKMTPDARTGAASYLDANATAAKLRGIADSFDGGFVSAEWTVYFLYLYGQAIACGIHTPRPIRRWAESLSEQTMRRAMGDAARHDTQFRESTSYHEGVREPSWFTHVHLGIRRATIAAFMANPTSALGLLHVECLDL
jgi:hypothetical protein